MFKLNRVQIIYTALRVSNYFPVSNHFPIDETLLAFRYSIAIFMTYVRGVTFFISGFSDNHG